MVEASTYAALKLAEVETQAHMMGEIHSTPQPSSRSPWQFVWAPILAILGMFASRRRTKRYIHELEESSPPIHLGEPVE